jgi:hypothetical protein
MPGYVVRAALHGQDLHLPALRVRPMPATSRRGRARAMSTEPYIDARALAELMGVSVSTVKRWVAAGCPSETWAMHVRRFRASEVIAWRRTVAGRTLNGDKINARPVAPVGQEPKE